MFTPVRHTSGKPVMYMEALIHAREWITGASMYWIIEHILSQYGTTSREGEAITRIVEGVDMYFTLVTNPDGYVVRVGSGPDERDHA